MEHKWVSKLEDRPFIIAFIRSGELKIHWVSVISQSQTQRERRFVFVRLHCWIFWGWDHQLLSAWISSSSWRGSRMMGLCIWALRKAWRRSWWGWGFLCWRSLGYGRDLKRISRWCKSRDPNGNKSLSKKLSIWSSSLRNGNKLHKSFKRVRKNNTNSFGMSARSKTNN